MSGRDVEVVVRFAPSDPAAVEILGGFDPSIGTPDWKALTDEDTDDRCPIEQHVAMALGAMVDGLADDNGRTLVVQSIERR